MQRRQWFILGTAAALVAVGVLSFRLLTQAPPAAQGRPAPPPTTVKVAEVRYHDTAPGFAEYGRVTSAQPISVKAEVNGTLLPGEVPLKAAGRFQPGQELFSIDATEARLALKAQKAELLQRVATALPDFKLDFEERFADWQAFFTAISINEPLPPLPTAATPRERAFVANRGILTAYYNITSAEDRLRRYTYAAPYAGSIVEVIAEVGSIVTPGTPVVEIIRTDQLELELPVPVARIAGLQPGLQVRVTDRDKQQTWPAVVARIGDYVDPATQAAKVFLRLVPVAGQPLFEGQYLYAQLPGLAYDDVFSLPRRALDNGEQVWIVQNGKLAQARTTVVAVNPENVLVRGLKPGTLVLLDPPTNAQVGTPVNPSRTAQP